MYLETADIETASDDYATRFSGAVGEYFLQVQLDITKRCLDNDTEATILDVGGGHGQLAIPLVQQGYRVSVTGSNESCRSRLDRYLQAGSFSFEVADILALPYNNDTFDYVLAFRLLPHVERWPQLLAEMCRVARKAVIFDYPDIRSSNILYNSLFSMKKKYEKNTRTFTLFNRAEIAAELDGCNFSPPEFIPQFLLPMVLHRKLNHVGLSRSAEMFFRLTFLTRLFGSPVITKSVSSVYQRSEEEIRIAAGAHVSHAH